MFPLRALEYLLEEQVRAGVCANAGELANDVLRSVRELRRKPFKVTPKLEAWLLEAACSYLAAVEATCQLFRLSFPFQDAR